MPASHGLQAMVELPDGVTAKRGGANPAIGGGRSWTSPPSGGVLLEPAMAGHGNLSAHWWLTTGGHWVVALGNLEGTPVDPGPGWGLVLAGAGAGWCPAGAGWGRGWPSKVNPTWPNK